MAPGFTKKSMIPKCINMLRCERQIANMEMKSHAYPHVLELIYYRKFMLLRINQQPHNSMEFSVIWASIELRSHTCLQLPFSRCASNEVTMPFWFYFYRRNPQVCFCPWIEYAHASLVPMIFQRISQIRAAHITNFLNPTVAGSYHGSGEIHWVHFISGPAVWTEFEISEQNLLHLSLRRFFLWKKVEKPGVWDSFLDGFLLRSNIRFHVSSATTFIAIRD